MPDPEGHDLLHDWQRAMQSLISTAPKQLLEPMQRQLELIHEVIEQERRLQREVVGRVTAPFDLVFDLLEQSAQTMRQQAEALQAAGQALGETAGLVKTQAELFERTLGTLREPTELAKAAAGLERRPRRRSGRRQSP